MARVARRTAAVLVGLMFAACFTKPPPPGETPLDDAHPHDGPHTDTGDLPGCPRFDFDMEETGCGGWGSASLGSAQTANSQLALSVTVTTTAGIALCQSPLLATSRVTLDVGSVPNATTDITTFALTTGAASYGLDMSYTQTGMELALNCNGAQRSLVPWSADTLPYLRLEMAGVTIAASVTSRMDYPASWQPVGMCDLTAPSEVAVELLLTRTASAAPTTAYFNSLEICP